MGRAFPAFRGPPGPFVADHDDVARFHLVSEDFPFDRVSWLSEDDRLAGEGGDAFIPPAVLTMQPSCEVAVKARQAAVLGVGVFPSRMEPFARSVSSASWW